MQEAPSFRVSPQQEQLWVEEPEGPKGRIQAVVELEGSFEPADLQAALERLVQRHEILRTTFVHHAGIRVPLQVIHDSLAPQWDTLDLRGAGEAERPTRIRAAADEELRRPLDFEHGPLVHALLADAGDRTRTFVLTLPSPCADDRSMGVLLEELVALVAGDDVAGEPLQYADFSEWQHEQLSAVDDAGQAAKAFWQRATDAPVPRVPLAGTAPATPALDEAAVSVDAELCAGTAEVAARYSSTTAVLVQAAWHAFLSRVTGQDELLVTTLNATSRHPDLEGAVGLIARPLPVRTPVPAELTFAELVDQLDRELATAASHQDRLPAATIPAGPGFVVRSGFDAVRNGVRYSLTRIVDSGTTAPLALAYEESPDGDLGLALVFDRETIEPGHAKMLADQFERLLRSALASPGDAVGDLELLGDDDLRLLLAGFNDTAADVPAARVHELFEQRAAETPEATAVSDGHDSLTYATLDGRANQLAQRLRHAGIGAGDVVALSTDRSVEMVVGVLGILKAGGAYLPLNQEHPVARLRHQAEESGARVLVTQEPLLDGLPDFDEVVCLDRDRSALDLLETRPPEAVGGLDDLVYVIYTSGSTGTPKGVSVTHRNLSNYVDDMIRRLGAQGRAYVFGMVSAISTDLGNTAFYPSLCSGGTLALVRPEAAADPAAFALRVAESPLDVLKITPSHLSALLRTNEGRLLPREWLILGGERLGWDLVDRVRALSDCRILNHYGPTETTIGSCTMLVEDGRDPYAPVTVPIGRPISNTRCYVLDDRLQPVPLGVPGRLFVGGAGVARGYIGQPELTAERFVDEPFAAPGQRMYDTGDLVRRLPDGAIEFLGRADEQVKIRGNRVEPSEVESALRGHPAVANAAVVPVEDAGGDVRLVAYYELGSPIEQDDLRRHVAEWVPDFMIPSAFVVLDALPLTASGKVDRLALPALADAAPGMDGEYVAPRSAVEEAVAAIWADVLGLERVSVEADFFALGGHSLLATQVVAQVRTDFAIELPLHSLFMYPTVASLSEEIAGLMGAAEQDETAKLLEELEGLSDEEASQLVGELGRGDEAAR